MSRRKRLRDLSNLDFQAKLQEVTQDLCKMSWRLAEACQSAESRVGGKRWLEAPEKIDVGAWVIKEQKIVYDVWLKKAVCETLPEKFVKDNLRVMIPSEFGDHETAFRQSSVWLHMTEALPSEAVMEVLSATVGKKPQKLINLIGRMSSSDLVAVNEFAEEHKIQPVAKATEHAHEPLQKKSKSEMDEQASLGSAAKPQRARMGQGAPLLRSEGSVNQGTPFPPGLGKPTNTSFVVIRISDGAKGKDGWRMASDISNRAKTTVYVRKEEELPALLARLQGDPSRVVQRFSEIPAGKEKEFYGPMAKHLEAEAVRLGQGPLKVFCIADKSNEALSVLVKTGKVQTYLSGTNDLLFTDATELEYALSTASVHFDLKTTKEATGVSGQGIYQLWGAIANGEIPPLMLIGDGASKCSLAYARDCTTENGAEDYAIEVFEDVNPSTAVSVAFAWNLKARQQLAGEEGLPGDFVRGFEALKGRCMAVSRETIAALLKVQEESAGATGHAALARKA